jgi:transposase
MTSMTNDERPVTGGVDTHGETHHAAVIDSIGRQLGDKEFPATPAGYRALLRWMQTFGTVDRVGVEGTGSYGLGLTHILRREQVRVVEVDRPNRRARRLKGKSDPLDAYAAARAALNGDATGTPKTRDGHVEMIRMLKIQRKSAIKARTQTMNQLKALIVTAPEDLREQLRGLSAATMINTCASARPAAGPLREIVQVTKTVLRRLAQRHQVLTAEIAQADIDLKYLVELAAPALLELTGVGIDVAGQLLVSFGDNADRITSEAAFAHLCGVAPVPASTARSDRHRLNRSGDRQANRVLYVIAISRMHSDPRTREYVARRTAQGLSKKDIIRCLKRYIAREIYQLHTKTQAATKDTTQAA